MTHRYDTALAQAAHAGFANFGRSLFQVQHGLGAVNEAAVRREAHGVHTYFGAAATGYVADLFHVVVVFPQNSFHIGQFLGSVQTVLEHVDDDDAGRTTQPG